MHLLGEHLGGHHPASGTNSSADDRKKLTEVGAVPWTVLDPARITFFVKRNHLARVARFNHSMFFHVLPCFLYVILF